MKQKVIKAAYIVVGVLVVLWVIGTITKTNPKQTTPSDEAIYNTSMNSFVSACSSQPNANQTECTCGWNKLSAYYKQQGDSKWYSDTVLTSRIISQGYNQAETDTIVSCFK